MRDASSVWREAFAHTIGGVKPWIVRAGVVTFNPRVVFIRLMPGSAPSLCHRIGLRAEITEWRRLT